MKSNSFIVPILVAILGGLWLGWQQHQITSLQKESDDLSQRLKLAASQSGPPTRRPLPPKNPLDARPIDWHLVSNEFRSGTFSTGIFRSTFGLDEKILRLGAAELKEGLKDIENSDLDERMRLVLTRKLLNTLLEKDPGHLLVSPSKDPQLAPAWIDLRRQALGKWAKASPREASDWFDSQSPESFPAHDYQELKHGLISSLTISDFQAALTRFETIPEAKRADFFRDYNAFGESWESSDFANHDLAFRFAELARVLPPDQRKQIIPSPLTWLGEQDRPSGIYNLQKSLKGWENAHPGPLSMETLSDFLTKIRPTQDEQNLCLDAVIEAKCLYLPNQPERDSETLRTWLQSELKSTIHTK